MVNDIGGLLTRSNIKLSSFDWFSFYKNEAQDEKVTNEYLFKSKYKHTKASTERFKTKKKNYLKKSPFLKSSDTKIFFYTATMTKFCVKFENFLEI